MRVLLVEDDPLIGSSLSRALHEQGILVDWARTGEEGGEVWRRKDYAAVLLDVGLPRQSGVDLLREIRAEQVDTPTLIITARADVDDRVRSLDLGADDYIVKPFELREVLARLRAVLRRHNGSPRTLCSAGEITVDLASHRATYRQRTVRLSARELALLHLLMRQPGRIVSQQTIEQEIYSDRAELESNAVAVLIHGIRRKFDRDIIRNVRGAGWLVSKDAA